MTHLDLFYENLNEPLRSHLLSLREFILSHDQGFEEKYKYKLPFFYYLGKPFCYLWKHKTTEQPYLGFSRGHLSNHPKLSAGDRTRIKILNFDIHKDIDYAGLDEILKEMKELY